MVEMTDKMFAKLKQREEQSKLEAQARRKQVKQRPYYELNQSVSFQESEGAHKMKRPKASNLWNDEMSEISLRSDDPRNTQNEDKNMN